MNSNAKDFGAYAPGKGSPRMEILELLQNYLRWYLELSLVRPYNDHLSNYETIRQIYNPSISRIVCCLYPETAARCTRIQKVILTGKDDDVLFLRQAVTDECNLTAVAGAIVAQVAITGLSLQDLSSTHWMARACFLFAVASGCLAVYYSCVLQRTIGQLYTVDMIKDWLSRPAQEPLDSGSTPRASLAAAFIISAPFNMMKVSISSFLIGLAIYQGFTWSRSLDTTANPGDSRKVFITFMVGAGSCVIFYLYSFSSKSFENMLPFPSELGNLWRVSIREAGHALNAQQHQDNDRAPTDLAAAMKAAAQAHSQCAEAENRVALEYSRAFHTEHNDKEEDGLYQNERSEPGP